MLKKKWFGRQKWSDIVFAHWPVDKFKLQHYVPYPFRVATINNQAYLSVVAFQAKDSTFRNFPDKLSFRPFWQINVRTYIQFGREFGIYFFALYSNDLLAVLMGRLPGLPYKQAAIEILKQKDQKALFLSENTGRQEIQLTYSDQYTTKISEDKRTNFLTNHNKLYFMRKNKIYQGKVSHKPWQLFYVDGQAQLAGFSHSSTVQAKQPLLMVANNQQSYLYPFRKLGYIFP